MEDDLQSLLDQLNPDKETNLWNDGVLDKSDTDGLAEIVESEESPINTTPVELVPVSEIGTKSSMAYADASQEEVAVDPKKYLRQLDDVTIEVLDACRSDRQDAQDIITMLKREIEGSIQQGKSPSKTFVDGLVKAVEVKTNVNTTVVKMMEANAKMLAAMKVSSGTNVQINNVTASGVTETDQSLEKILDEPLTSEDEY
jgi:hypothetical protein